MLIHNFNIITIFNGYKYKKALRYCILLLSTYLHLPFPSDAQERKSTTIQAHQAGQKGDDSVERPTITSHNKDRQKPVHEVAKQVYQINNQNNLVMLPDLKLQDLLMHWLQRFTQTTLPLTIYHSYHELIDLHLIPSLGIFTVQSILPEHIQQFYDQKYTEEYPTQIIDSFHYILQQSLDTALHLHLVEENICDTVDPTCQPKDEISIQLSHLDLKKICRVLVRIAVYFEEDDHAEISP